MATRIRLQRRGRKKRAFFQIVVADTRAPRDGRYIEKIGSYNPMTNPATITLNVDRATEWVMTGAQPSDTAAAILRYKGVMFKKHLQVGVNKGAVTQEDADKRFAAWVEEKESKIEANKVSLNDSLNAAKAALLKAETAKKEAIAAKVIAKNNPEMEAETAEEGTEEAPVAEEVTEEAPAAEVEAPVEEAPVAEEVTEEAPAAEVEAPAEDAPVAEEVTEEAPAAEVEAPAEDTPTTEEKTED